MRGPYCSLLHMESIANMIVYLSDHWNDQLHLHSSNYNIIPSKVHSPEGSNVLHLCCHPTALYQCIFSLSENTAKRQKSRFYLLDDAKTTNTMPVPREPKNDKSRTMATTWKFTTTLCYYEKHLMRYSSKAIASSLLPKHDNKNTSTKQNFQCVMTGYHSIITNRTNKCIGYEKKLY